MGAAKLSSAAENPSLIKATPMQQHVPDSRGSAERAQGNPTKLKLQSSKTHAGIPVGTVSMPKLSLFQRRCPVYDDKKERKFGFVLQQHTLTLWAVLPNMSKLLLAGLP